MRPLRFCLTLLALLLAAPALAVNPLTHRVNEVALTGSDVAAAPAPCFSPDGEWVVYLHDADVNDEFQLWAARRWAGSAPVRLSDALTNVLAFELTADGSRVVYLADEDGAGVYELWSVPVDGSAAPVQLNPNALATRDVKAFALTPDGARAVLVGDLAAEEQDELWSVPVAGPAAAADKLSPAPQVAGADVESFVVADGSARVLFAGVLRSNGVRELWSAPIAGPAPSLNSHLTPAASAGAAGLSDDPALAYRSTFDGARALFAGDFETPGTIQLYANTMTGGPGGADALHALPVAGGNVGAFALVLDAARVVFRADLQVDERQELWSATLDGTDTDRISHGTLQAAGDVTDFAVGAAPLPAQCGVPIRRHPALGRVLFRADAQVDERYDLYQVPLAGGVSPTRLNVITAADGDVEPDFAVAPDGARVVFRGNNTSASRLELYSAATNGAAGSALRLTPSSPINGANVTDFEIAATSARVVLAGDFTVNGRFELYSAPIATANSMVKLHPNAGLDEEVIAFALARDGRRVALLADFTVNGRYALWTVPASGPGSAAVQAHAEAVTGGDAVVPLVWSDDGLGVVFPGDLDFDERFHLWDADEAIFRADHEEGDTSEWSAEIP